MAFHPHSSSTQGIYDQNRFSEQNAFNTATTAGIARSVIGNKSYVLAAQRAAEYDKMRQEELLRQQRKQQSSSSRSGLFGKIGGIAGGLIGSVFGPAGSAVGSAIGGGLGSRIG
jgi:hypothetical protein